MNKPKGLMKMAMLLIIFMIASPTLSQAKDGQENDVQHADLGNNGHENYLKVMTYNLKNGQPTETHSWQDRLPIMKKLLENEKPDVMGTQEGLKFQLEDLKSELTGYDWIGKSRGGPVGDDEYMAIFYNKSQVKLMEHGNFWLSDTPDKPGSMSFGNVMPRMVTWAKFKDKDTNKQFYTLNTHFPYQSTKEGEIAREKSAKLIAKKLNELDPSLPVFLIGDFNSSTVKYPKSHQILTNKGNLTDTWFTAKSKINEDYGTWHDYREPKGDSEWGRIDWILAKGPVSIQQYKVNNFTEDGEYPSDHYPVIDKVKLTPPSATDMKRLVKRYEEKGEIQKTFAEELKQRLDMIKQLFDQGSNNQAVAYLQDFTRHIIDPSVQEKGLISDKATQVLKTDAGYLIKK